MVITTEPKVLISILNWRNFPSTKKCIESLLRQEYYNYQIVVVDNCSQDDSVVRFKNELPNIPLIVSKSNNGYASGHKLAVNYALANDFNCIWILNNDLTVRPKALSALVQAFIENGEGIYGSISIKSENPDIVNYGGGKINDISLPLNYNSYEDYLLLDYLNEETLRMVQSVEGSSILIPINVIKRHGFMREDFFMYVEETDYCYRLNKKGIMSYVVPQSIVTHKGAESLKDKSYIERYYRRRNLLYFEKEHYSKNILINIHQKFGLHNVLKYFIKRILLIKSQKDDLYYLNLANIHALSGVKGKIEC